MCLAAHTSARSLCRCKQVCSAQAPAYIRLRFACRIYCSASAEQSPLPDRILFGDISVPCSTHICEKPLPLQTSLHRAGSSHLSLRFLYLQMGRQIFLLCSRFLRIFVTVLFYTKKREYYGKRECRCRKEQCRKT